MSGSAGQGTRSRDPLRILLLGGTSEASALARLLADDPDFAVTLSLAGRTAAPRPEPVPTRIGGFGGGAGLAQWLGANGIEVVIDATHPFAARISANAALVCRACAVPLLAVHRPPWERRAGDDWTEVPSVAACLGALGPIPKTVFVTIGRQEVSAFARAPHHAYIVRTIEPVGDALRVPHLVTVGARGPFTLEDETRFMREARVEVLVTKNSGGAATYPKIEAARRLGIRVVIVARPALPDVPSVPDAVGALRWLKASLTERSAS